MIHNKKPPPKTPPKTQTNQKKKAMNQNNKNQPKSRTFIPSKRKPPTELIKIVKANMDFQLGLKFKTRPNRDIEDELTFFSTETDDSFYLVLSNLSGFKTDELDIKISDDGKTITVRGGRVFDDVVAAAGDLTVRREMRIGRFKKEFRIPDGVDLDRIDADLDEDHGILYVYLPKAAAMAAVAKEVHGVLPEIGAEKSYPVADRLEEAEAEAIAPDSNASSIEAEAEAIAPDSNQASSIEAEEEATALDSERASIGSAETDRDREGSRSEEVDEGKGDLDRPMEDGGESRGDAVAEAAEGEGPRSMMRGGMGLLARSALILSLVVIAFRLMRNKRRGS